MHNSFDVMEASRAKMQYYKVIFFYFVARFNNRFFKRKNVRL